MIDPVRQEVIALAHTVVVKVGTNVLTRADGTLEPSRVQALADQLQRLRAGGRKVALVSSGAIGAGVGRLGLGHRPTDLRQLQACAAVGQSFLMRAYEDCLAAHDIPTAQILLTAGDFDSRARYLNARNTIVTLFEWGCLPIINENDTVSVDELQTTFGDNDRLAAMVTNLLRAPLLVLLSDVDGLYDGDPGSPGAKVIPTVSKLDESVLALVRDRRTGLSKGGMASKLAAARMATLAGENVIIANGREPGAIGRILAGEVEGTLVVAQGQAITSWKRWIGFTAQPRGYLVLDDGARSAIEKQGRSLLAIGIVDCTGEFKKGDVVAVRDTRGAEFARGLTNYAAADVLRIKGLKTGAIAAALGHCPYQEVIHRDNMVVTT
jgi:glutamate 5-kinase